MRPAISTSMVEAQGSWSEVGSSRSGLSNELETKRRASTERVGSVSREDSDNRAEKQTAEAEAVRSVDEGRKAGAGSVAQ